MKSKYTENQKEKVIGRYQCGERVAEISDSSGVPKTTIYSWIRALEANETPHKKAVNLKMYHELETKYLRQKKIIQILHESPYISNFSLDERIKAIDSMVSEKNTVNMLCEALCVAKGTYYNRKLRGKHGYTEAMKKREAIKPIIKEIYDESNQIYGPGKVHAILKDRGYTCSINVVESIMHQNNWFSVRTGAKALYAQSLLRRENLVKQQFKVKKPNEIWVSDVTSVVFKEKRLFLCVVMDLYARKIIAYKYSDKNNTSLTKKTFDAAYKQRQPDENLVFHSDQGANYTSRTFRQFLKSRNVKQSFSRGGVPYDNSVCESFFSIYKQEEYYRRNYTSLEAVKQGINDFMVFYNTKRPHSMVRYRTPDAIEQVYMEKIKESCPSNIEH